jgi:hypothetical protein
VLRGCSAFNFGAQEMAGQRIIRANDHFLLQNSAYRLEKLFLIFRGHEFWSWTGSG